LASRCGLISPARFRKVERHAGRRDGQARRGTLAGTLEDVAPTALAACARARVEGAAGASPRELALSRSDRGTGIKNGADVSIRAASCLTSAFPKSAHRRREPWRPHGMALVCMLTERQSRTAPPASALPDSLRTSEQKISLTVQLSSWTQPSHFAHSQSDNRESEASYLERGRITRSRMNCASCRRGRRSRSASSRGSRHNTPIDPVHRSAPAPLPSSRTPNHHARSRSPAHV
jgi:hypothetical protein